LFGGPSRSAGECLQLWTVDVCETSPGWRDGNGGVVRFETQVRTWPKLYQLCTGREAPASVMMTRAVFVFDFRLVHESDASVPQDFNCCPGDEFENQAGPDERCDNNIDQGARDVVDAGDVDSATSKEGGRHELRGR
jgi:hypothetical protein